MDGVLECDLFGWGFSLCFRSYDGGWFRSNDIIGCRFLISLMNSIWQYFSHLRLFMCWVLRSPRPSYNHRFRLSFRLIHINVAWGLRLSESMPIILNISFTFNSVDRWLSLISIRGGGSSPNNFDITLRSINSIVSLSFIHEADSRIWPLNGSHSILTLVLVCLIWHLFFNLLDTS